MRPEGAARLAWLLLLAAAAAGHGGVQPLSRIAIHRARVALDASAAVRASPELLGTKVCTYSSALYSDALDFFFLLGYISATCVLGIMHYCSMCRPSPAHPWILALLKKCILSRDLPELNKDQNNHHIRES